MSEVILVNIATEWGMSRDFLTIHERSECSGMSCCIHNPSEHPLNNEDFIWRADRGLMERQCRHGIGHPDLDDLSYKRATMPDYDVYAFSIHGCDGCCG